MLIFSLLIHLVCMKFIVAVINTLRSFFSNMAHNNAERLYMAVVDEKKHFMMMIGCHWVDWLYFDVCH